MITASKNHRFAGTRPRTSSDVPSRTGCSPPALGLDRESPATAGKSGPRGRLRDDFSTKVRGVYVSAGGWSGVRPVARCRTSLRKCVGRSVGQGKAVRPCRRQPEGGDLDGREADAIMSTSPGATLLRKLGGSRERPPVSSHGGRPGRQRDPLSRRRRKRRAAPGRGFVAKRASETVAKR
jgi:hypothetical protein